MAPPKRKSPSSAKAKTTPSRRPASRRTKQAPGGLKAGLSAFVAERFPFALSPAAAALDRALEARGGDPGRDAEALDALRGPLRDGLGRAFAPSGVDDLPDSTPGVAAAARLAAAAAEIVEACDGFLRRESVAASLTPEERREIL